MDATRAFIVREGVGRLSIDKIVKESGTSKGAFLYHFKNRKALFCALVEEYVDHLNERMNAHMGKYQNSEEPLILGYASGMRTSIKMTAAMPFSVLRCWRFSCTAGRIEAVP